ncbi:MAG: ABC transporter permease [Euzebyales bacterium]|jgi:peptide/nickel transport system permease protein|nr:ABC transporter permease [Euzebyales bacterium]
MAVDPSARVDPGSLEPRVAVPGKGRSRRAQVWRRFRRNKTALVGLTCVVLFVLAALFAPVLAPFTYNQNFFEAVLAPPGGEHLMGTDDLGRDIYSRVLHGARVSMQAAVMATVLAMVVSLPLGLVAGYYRGAIDSVIMRLVDALLAFPFIILAIALAAILGPSLMNVTIALGVGSVPSLIRIIRGEVLGLREEDYVDGAIASGATDVSVLSRHIVPNLMNTLLVQATVMIPGNIIGEATLSYLGLGVQLPRPSWGVMLNAAQQNLSSGPWMLVFPGAAICIATLAFNLFGDGVRDVLDPKTHR